MINRILSFFSSGNTYNATNIKEQNNYSSEVKTLLESLDEHFCDGKITKAFELLNTALEKHQHKESKYYILLKKAEYFLELRNSEKTKNILEVLNKDYNEYKDIRYKELLLSIYSAEKNEKDFFELVKDLKTEKDDIKSNDYFKIIFYLNSGNIEESKKLFNSLSKEKQEKNHLIAGHIFSNSYNYLNKNEEDLKKANTYYKLVLETNPSFLIKLHIKGFFIQIIINEYFRVKKEFKNEVVIEYKELLDKLLEAEKFLNQQYINELKNFKAYLLLILDLKNDYIDFYEKNSEILFDEHYLQYCNYKNININHSLIQKKVLQNYKVLLIYSSLLLIKNENTKIILSYFNKNTELLLKSDTIIYFYVFASINENTVISKNIANYINSNLEKNLELYFSHLLLKKNENKKIKNIEITTLFNFLEKANILNDIIFEVIDFLMEVKKSELYIKLAILKQNEFKNLIGYILKKCYEDKEIKISDFENFIKSIKDKSNYYGHIADVYFKFNRLDKAFEFYYKIWEKNKDIISAKNVLITGLHNFEKNKNRLSEENENEVLYYLQSMQKELDFTDINLISYFNLFVNRDVNNAFGIINKKILSLNIDELDNENKMQLASMYFSSITNFKDKEIDGFQKNTIYYKNKNYYLDKELFQDVHEIYLKKFKILLIDKLEINKISDDKTYEHKSLFHSIINEILETVDSPYFKVMKVDWGIEKPFEDLQKFLSSQNIKSNNLIKKYSEGKEIGFWSLSKGYDKYFNLIVKLLEEENLNFNSCRVNFKDKNTPKLLTLSSIIFLNYWDKLATVLKREDVYIQKSTFDYLLSYKEKLNKENELLYVFEEDGKLCKNIITKEQITLFLDNLKKIINNIAYVKIIDDTKSTLLFKESFSITEYIGIQEYHAIALSFEKNYQLITEDRMLEVIFEILKFNTTMISNSLSLLKREDIINLGITLHKKNYKYVFDITIIQSLLDNLINLLINSDISTNKLSVKEINLLNILNDYGFLEKIKEVYFHHYKVLYPKVVLPKEDNLSKNLEYIIACIYNKFNHNNDLY
jgi:hypothetical protein